jgi:hypothetical protein
MTTIIDDPILRQGEQWKQEIAARQAQSAAKTETAPTPESNPETFELAQPDQNGEFASPLDGALWMARVHGKRQIPLNGKAAFLTNWQEQATTDPVQIRDWYEQFRCNFGSVADDGEIFEVDSPEVRKRFHGQFSNTLTVASSEGKRHRYYLPADVEHISQNAVKHGDFSLRKHNAYCVSPGSVHPQTGKQYRVVIDAPMVAPTKGEIAFWNSERVEKKTAPAPAGESIPTGQRNSTITSILGKARQNVGADYDSLIALARQHNQRCVPPLPESELETISRSIAGYDVHPVGKFEFQKQTAQAATEDLSWLDLSEVTARPVFPDWIMKGTSLYEGLAKPVSDVN